MERIRAVTAATAEESAPPEVVAVEPGAAALLSLRERVEVVTSPGVTREDVESLLDGLSAPLAPGESTRARANQLLRLLQDEALGELTGGPDDRQVRPAALEALIGLGFPYALEVPPDVLAEMRSGPRELSRASRWGLGLAAVNALVPVMGEVVTTSPSRWLADLKGLAILAGVLFVPAVLSALGERYRLKSLKSLGNGGLVLLGGVGLIPAYFMNRDGFSWGGATVLGISLALLTSAFLLRHRPEYED